MGTSGDSPFDGAAGKAVDRIGGESSKFSQGFFGSFLLYIYLLIDLFI
jgi:hypothetical protein